MAWLQIFALMVSAVGAPTAAGASVGGDVDGSGVVDARDVQATINGVLGLPLPFSTDADGSGQTDAMDVQRVVLAALGVEVSPPPEAKSVQPRHSTLPDDLSFLPTGLRASLAKQPSAPGFTGKDAAAQAPAEAGLHRLGLIPDVPSQGPAAEKVLQDALGKRAKAGQPIKGPASCDNSAGLPPVGDQGPQGSCVSWATGYYMKTYQEGREHGWSLTDPAHQFSARFLYNQLQGFDEGTTFEGNLTLLNDQGCASLVDEPYNDTDYLTYPTAQSYRNAIPYRAQSYEYLGNGETYQVFDAVKALAAAGDVVAIGLPIMRPNPTTPGHWDLLSPSDYDYDLPPATDVYLAGFHAVTIVGYDESKFGGTGGYKIVNEWGTSWGNNGFAWLSQRFLNTFGFGFYRMVDRIGYQPTGMVHWKVYHPFWAWNYDNVTVTVGVGPTAMPFWSKVMVTHLERDVLTIDMWYDLSDAAQYLPPDWTKRWWLRIDDGSVEDVATLSIAEIEVTPDAYSADVVLPLYGNFGYSNHDSLVIYIPAGMAASANYYVNDDYDLTTDVYCTAAGNDSNDGLTPATPQRTIQAVIDRYTLKAGDTVWIDAGNYDLSADISITQLDRGASGSPVRGRAEAQRRTRDRIEPPRHNRRCLQHEQLVPFHPGGEDVAQGRGGWDLLRRHVGLRRGRTHC